MRHQVDFLLLLKLQKVSYYFGLYQKILLASQFAGFFIFDWFNLLILIRGSIATLYLLCNNTRSFQLLAITKLLEMDMGITGRKGR